MKILVTGATGFIGQRLSENLLSLHHELRLLVRSPQALPESLRTQCEIATGDITDPVSLAGCCDGIDAVFHLAALMGHDSPSEEAFARFRAVNVQGIKNIVQEAQKSGVKRFIHISSTAAMGLLRDSLVDESTPCKPYTPYQVTKYEGEQLLIQEYRDHGFPVIILRPSMIYGPGFKGDFLTLAKVCKTGFFPTIGRGKNLSPALYITDLIDALPLCLDHGRTGEIYLLSSEQSYPLRQVSEIIGKALNKKIIYLYVPVWLTLAGAWMLEKVFPLLGRRPPVTKRNIQSTVTDRVFNVSKAKEELGFHQAVSLEVGLTKAVEYFLQQNYL